MGNVADDEEMGKKRRNDRKEKQEAEEAEEE